MARSCSSPALPSDAALPATPVEQVTALTFGRLQEAFRDLADQSLQVLFPVEMPAGGLNRRDGYSCELHAKLCRCKFLGLSDRASAKMIGLHPRTVSQLKRRYPKLAADMDSAAELANAHAALLLRGLMHGGGPTAFQAVKFFLTTHSPEFKEVQHVDVQVDVGQTIRRIRTGLYGLPAEPDPAGPGDGPDDSEGLASEPEAVALPSPVPAEVPADVSGPSPAADCAAGGAADVAAEGDSRASGVMPPVSTDWANEL